MKDLFKFISVVIGAIIIVMVIVALCLFSLFGCPDKDYSVTDLKYNFDVKKTEIIELKKYFGNIVPANYTIAIEFTNDRTLDRFFVNDLGSGKHVIYDWKLEIRSKKIDSVLQILGWTFETLHTLKQDLDNANCIGIESGEPTEINFKRSGMGMYSFLVFDKPMSNSLKNQYSSDSCSYILVDEYLVLEYGGGAIGPQCFYNKK